MSRSTVKIPSRWTADQAMAIHELLHDLLDALWEVHGEVLIHGLRQEAERAEWERGLADHAESAWDEDDLPF